MKNQILNLGKAVLAVALVFVVSTESSAQSCPSLLKNKSGKVYSANPGVLKANSASNQVTISVKKTDGRAETQANIYVGGQYKGKIEFDNGRYTTNWKKKTVSGARGKEVRVDIVNQSVGNTFSYSAKIVGKTTRLSNNGSLATGRLTGQTQKTITSKSSCTGKAKVNITRTGGRAKGNIYVYEKRGTSWSSTPIKQIIINNNESSKVFTVNTNAPLKVVLKNVSVGNTISYSMDVKATS